VEYTRGCNKEYLYSADDTGQFYNMMPCAKFKVKGEICVGGKGCNICSAGSKCVNMTAIDKEGLFVIGRSHKPHCFMNVNKLPIEHAASNKTWLTSHIFQQCANGTMS
jgi:hypothetical protein